MAWKRNEFHLFVGGEERENLQAPGQQDPALPNRTNIEATLLMTGPRGCLGLAIVDVGLEPRGCCSLLSCGKLSVYSAAPSTTES